MGETGKLVTGEHLHLQLFWWGDVGTKAEFLKKHPGVAMQTGSQYINLNSPDISTCKGTDDLWDFDWGITPTVESMDGTSFSKCLENNNCQCLNDQ